MGRASGSGPVLTVTGARKHLPQLPLLRPSDIRYHEGGIIEKTRSALALLVS
jgi:hypothetical protein